MSRELLPERRFSLTFTVEFQGEKYNVTIGFYDDGRPGEVFINRLFTKTSAKVGTLLDGVCRDAAILISIALQHGCHSLVMQHAVTRDEDGHPSTIVGAIIDRITKSDLLGGDDDAAPVSPTPRPQGGRPTLAEVH